MIPLILASGNSGKLRELQAFFATLPTHSWELQLKPPELEIAETGLTFAENAQQKAQGVALATGHWAIADDSGLSVVALGGAPGIYSARYASTDPERIARLLQALGSVFHREAEFCAAIAVSDPQGRIRALAEGRCQGEILRDPRGSGGFGYDPVFRVPEAGLTFAEMSAEEKQKRGHRGQALRALAPQLQKLSLGEKLKNN